MDFSQIENLIYDEAEFLDTAQYDKWLDLFTEDATYWVPRSREQKDPLNEISLFYERRPFLEMRMNRLMHPNVHSASSPYAVSHLVSAIRLVSMNEEQDEATVQSRFHMQEFHEDRERHFSGRFLHTIVSENGALKIKMKRVDLVNCEAIFEPIEIPI